MWAFASLPVKTDELEKLLEFYPDRSIADICSRVLSMVLSLIIQGLEVLVHIIIYFL
jgi:hypothetical protein